MFRTHRPARNGNGQFRPAHSHPAPTRQIGRASLTLLQRDASLSLKDLAEAVNLTTTPCWKRVKRLEDEGYIRGRVALLDPQRLNLGLSVFVQLKTQRHDSAWLEDFARTVTAFEEVMEFYRMSGDWDYMLRVVVSDTPWSRSSTPPRFRCHADCQAWRVIEPTYRPVGQSDLTYLPTGYSVDPMRGDNAAPSFRAQTWNRTRRP